jgi:phosphohistidine phosphatase
MRRLLILRHAKAERLGAGQRDHERRLNGRGRDDAPRLGAYIARHRFVPDQALVSPAARTRETWQLAAKAMAAKVPVEFEESIYEATPETLLKIVKRTAPKVETLLLVGHNPGLHELAVMLVASGDIEARQRMKENFPTAALAVIEFALGSWQKLHPQAGRLERFIEPRSIAEASD